VEAALTVHTRERRAVPRIRCAEDHGIQSASIRPGRDARVLDVSAGGALVETRYRLLPGSSVELHVQFASFRTTARGRVVRCSVSGVRPTAMSYRGAIAFDRHLPWFMDDERRYGETNYSGRPAHPFRAEATPEAL
jgi:PilZ domain-containing protein